MAAKLGLKAWPKDILRQTAASMLMASLRSLGELRLGKPPGRTLAAP